MARIISARERRGQPLWGRYACDELGSTALFSAEFDLFARSPEVQQSWENSNSEGQGWLPAGTAYRIQSAGTYLDASDPLILGLFANTARFEVNVHNRAVLTLAGARRGWNRLGRGALAELRGETDVHVAELMLFGFWVHAAVELVEAVRCVASESVVDPSQYVELLGWMLGESVRDIL